MLRKAYGAGWRVGYCSGVAINDAVCPYPRRRFLSRSAWHNGLADGIMKATYNSDPLLKHPLHFELWLLAFVILLVFVAGVACH